MSCPATSIQGFCERDGVRGKGEGARAVVESDSCGKEAEDHNKIYFGNGKGAAETEIFQEW